MLFWNLRLRVESTVKGKQTVPRRDGLAGKLLVVKERGPKFNLQTPCEKLPSNFTYWNSLVIPELGKLRQVESWGSLAS